MRLDGLTLIVMAVEVLLRSELINTPSLPMFRVAATMSTV
jgi:hypothetical protein